MRIGFDAKRAFFNRSGLGNYSRNLLRSLHRFAPEIEPWLFTPQASNFLFEPYPGSRIIEPQGIWKGFPSIWRSIYMAKEIHKHPLHLYHGLSHELPQGIAKIPIPSVVTMHDLIFLRYPEFYRPSDRKMYAHKFRFAAQKATKVIAISNQTKSDLISFFSIEEEKIEVIYQSCFPVFYQKLSPVELSTVAMKYRLPTDFFLTVGNVEARKNLKGIIEALAISGIDLPLVVVGKPGRAMPEALSTIAKYQLSKQVHFISDLDFSDLPALYQLALFSVYPSFFEGFGLPVLESQASACPVICSNISSMPEAGGNGAWYVDPNKPDEIAEGLQKLAEDSDLREEFRKKGIANSEKFKEENVIQPLLTLYRKVSEEFQS